MSEPTGTGIVPMDEAERILYVTSASVAMKAFVEAQMKEVGRTRLNAGYAAYAANEAFGYADAMLAEYRRRMGRI